MIWRFCLLIYIIHFIWKMFLNSWNKDIKSQQNDINHRKKLSVNTSTFINNFTNKYTTLPNKYVKFIHSSCVCSAAILVKICFKPIWSLLRTLSRIFVFKIYNKQNITPQIIPLLWVSKIMYVHHVFFHYLSLIK